MATAWKDQVFAAVSEAAAIDTIKLFRPDPAEAAEQKRQFMAGEVRNPRYTYQALKGKRLGPVLDRLERAIETDSQLVEELDASPLSRLFGESLERRRALLRLARAAQSRDMTAFAAANRDLRFEPSEDIFQSILTSLYRRLQSDPYGSTELLLEILPEHDGTSMLPSHHLIERSRDALLALKDEMKIPTRVRTKGYWDAQYFAWLFERSFKSAGLEGWAPEITTKQARMSMSGIKRRIFIPADRVVPAKTALSSLVHERLHAERRYRGEQTGYFLLSSSGTASNRWAEEGVTTVTEQAVTGEARFHRGEEAYLATSLAAGLIDGRPRDFRTIYECMVIYYRLIDEERMPADRSLETPEERAWIRTNRVFRGTDCQTPGVYYGKDLIYAAGNLNIWALMERNPERVQYFTAGKFNPADDEEVRVLTQAGLIPALH